MKFQLSLDNPELDARFDEIDVRLDSYKTDLDGRLNDINARFSRIETQLTVIQTVVQKETTKIMSALTDWAAAEQADLTKIVGLLTAIGTGVAGLDALIVQFEANVGTLSPAEVAALKAIKDASAGIVLQAAAIDTKPPAAPGLAITGPVSLLPGVVGEAYLLVTFVSTGGAPGADAWSATGLPDGLSITPTGVLSGIPTVAGTSTVTVTVTDTSGKTASVTLPLVVTVPIVVGP